MKCKGLVIFIVWAIMIGCNKSNNVPNDSSEKNNQLTRLYYGGDIITMVGDKETYAEAVVQKDGKIVFVGSKTEALTQYKGAKKLDLKGQTMMPSFIDPHSHFMSALRMVNQVNVAAPPVGSATNIEGIMKLLQAYKKEHNIKNGNGTLPRKILMNIFLIIKCSLFMYQCTELY